MGFTMTRYGDGDATNLIFLLNGSGSSARVGEWKNISEFDEVSIQAYSQSGTGAAGTFSGTINIQATLTKHELATPENAVSFTAAGVKRLPLRASFVRAQVPAGWAGHNYVILMKGWRYT